ncbi:aminoacyl-tRNA hydrolase [Dyadobacter luteus]|uniref:Aminoacyl-tRNA hydrolase n=1 Tax=Dyadobacter luteus TaxID=2259619 RepID=A0A3D8YDI3_9BACT|nr:alternative ribosome rescue aminoacyl-tRNA hydrolase ArfB [Dyadobacter luteus]REA62516.1 aminoacyl-tRNA hydrolase [Dyadobacter luteus]
MIVPETLHSELVFQTARSGGSGGQNVNKVETKVELRFDVENSQLLTSEQKDIIYQKLGNQLTKERVLVLYHQTERSQLANKEKVIRKFDVLIANAFKPVIKRKPTKPTFASKIERLQSKQRNAMTKSLRRKPSHD